MIKIYETIEKETKEIKVPKRPGDKVIPPGEEKKGYRPPPPPPQKPPKKKPKK